MKSITFLFATCWVLILVATTTCFASKVVLNSKQQQQELVSTEVTTLSPPSPPVTTSSPIPTFNVRCSIDGVGPVYNPNFPSYAQIPLRGAGFGERTLPKHQDMFYVVSNVLPPTKSSSYSFPNIITSEFVSPISMNNNNKQENDENKAFNRLIIGIDATNCSILWTFEAPTSILISPMFDSERVVVQSYDVDTKNVYVSAIEDLTGKIAWEKSFKNVSSTGAFETQIHDGRVFFLSQLNSGFGTTTHYNKKNGTKTIYNNVGYELQAFHLKTGQFLYSFTQAVDIPEITKTPKVNLACNVLGDWCYLSVQNHIVAFEIITGMREWSIKTENLNETLFDGEYVTCSGASSATQGRPIKPWTSSSSSKVKDDDVNYGHTKPLHLYLFCENPKTAQGSLLVLHQLNGSVVYQAFKTQEQKNPPFANPLAESGSVQLSKYTDTGCFLRSKKMNIRSMSLVCFDVKTGSMIFDTENSAPFLGFTSSATVGYTEQNYYLGAALNENKKNVWNLVGLNDKGEIVFTSMNMNHNNDDDVVGVGAPKVYETIWDIAVLMYGKGKPGNSGKFQILRNVMA